MTPRPRKSTAKTPTATADAAIVVVAPPDEPEVAPVAPSDEQELAPVAAPEDTAPEEVEESRAGYSAVRVVDVAMVLPNPNPVLVLKELDPPNRRLTIPIGLAEGTAISYVLRGRPTPKPLTHELFVDVVSRLGGQVVAARLTLFVQGAFYAEVVVKDANMEHVISCRPSDAIALALRQGTPATIVVASALLDQLGTAGSATG